MLTKRQGDILDFIRRYIKDFGYAPTVRKIGDSFGIKSPNGVVCHLKALAKAGAISWEPHSARTLRILTDEPVKMSPMEKFVRSLLNPEELGHAVPAHVRDEARKVLGMEPCES